jgi:GT2 family glycosyltransferase
MADQSPVRVLAVVLTYSAPGALVSCVEAIAAQTRRPDEILIVDNAGDPPAAETLSSAGLLDLPGLRVLRAPGNGGPAGGHAIGLGELLAGGHDLAWVMDDDCVPEPECLEALLAEAVDPQNTFVFPTWIHPDGHVADYPAWNGFVLSRAIVEKVGLPMEELFWWGEDTEYLQWRIPWAGHPYSRSTAARVQHTKIRSAGAGGHPGWKYYYETRNTVYLRIRFRRNMRWIFRIVGTLAGRIVLTEDQKARKLWLLTRGLFDGLTRRLGKRVPVEAPRTPSQVAA